MIILAQGELKAQEEEIVVEMSKIDVRKETIKSKHPEVKKHIEKNMRKILVL